MSKRFIRWIIIVVCLFLIVTTGQSIGDLWHSGDKLARREKEITSLQEKKKKLLMEKAKVESPDFLEKIARDQLGMSKPGEQIIIIPSELLAQSPVATPDATPNWKKWLGLLL